MMKVKPVRTESDYEANLARVEELIDSEPGTPEGDEMIAQHAMTDKAKKVH